MAENEWRIVRDPMSGADLVKTMRECAARMKSLSEGVDIRGLISAQGSAEFSGMMQDQRNGDPAVGGWIAEGLRIDDQADAARYAAAAVAVRTLACKAEHMNEPVRGFDIGSGKDFSAMTKVIVDAVASSMQIPDDVLNSMAQDYRRLNEERRERVGEDGPYRDSLQMVIGLEVVLHSPFYRYDVAGVRSEMVDRGIKFFETQDSMKLAGLSDLLKFKQFIVDREIPVRPLGQVESVIYLGGSNSRREPLSEFRLARNLKTPHRDDYRASPGWVVLGDRPAPRIRVETYKYAGEKDGVVYYEFDEINYSVFDIDTFSVKNKGEHDARF
jgi:hypothetical protein